MSFCAEYAGLRSRSVEHACELCKWTDAIFEPPGPKETAEERRLRHAACLISDIGWRSHPDYRGEQSLNLLAHAGLAGIDHPGRIFLALSIYYRHAGAGQSHGEDLSERLKAIVSKKVQKRARIVGAAVRVAHMLSIGVAGVIDETPLSYDGNKLVLTIPRRTPGWTGSACAGDLRRWPSFWSGSPRFASVAEEGLVPGSRPPQFLLDCLRAVRNRDPSAMADDPYTILGVPKGASEDDIRRAFRKLAKELHPDVNRAGSDERFKKVSQAYEILGDAEKRKAYDRGEIDARGEPRRDAFRTYARGARAGAGAGFEDFGFGDIFSDMFAAAAAAPAPALPSRATTFAIRSTWISSRPCKARSSA